MNRLRAFALALLVLLPALIIATNLPGASATATSTTYRGAFGGLVAKDREVVQQAVLTMNGADTVACATISGAQSSANLVSGQTYFVTLGAATANLSVSVGSTLVYSMSTLSGSVSFLFTNAAWSPTLMWEEVESGTTVHSNVRIVAAASGQLTMACGANLASRTPILVEPFDAYRIGLHSLLSYTGDGGKKLGFIHRAENVTLASEASILAGQTDKTPSASRFSWTRLNPAVDFVNLGTTVFAEDAATQQFAQSFVPPASNNGFLERTGFRFYTASVACTSTVSVTITDVLPAPWNTANELMNATFTMTVTSTFQTTVYVNWTAGTVTDTDSGIEPGSATFKASGVSSPESHPVDLTTDAIYYMRIVVTDLTGGAGCGRFVTSAAGSSYSGGVAYKFTAGAWVAQSTDIAGTVLTSYGNDELSFRANLTDRNVGGAYYGYVLECAVAPDGDLAAGTPVVLVPTIGTYWNENDALDSANAFSGLQATTNLGGTAITADNGANLFQEETASCTSLTGLSRLGAIHEARFGYDDLPRNSSGTATLALNLQLSEASRSNVVYAGTLINQAGSTPNTITNVAAVTWDNQERGADDFATTLLFSTDDFFYNVTVHVEECSDEASPCATSGTHVADVSYSGTVQDVRTVAGTSDSGGHFYLTGQDVGGLVGTRLSLTKTGYSTATYTIRLSGGPGYYNVTLGLAGSGAGDVVVTGGAFTLSWSGNATRVVPDAVTLSVTRSRTAQVYLDVYMLRDNSFVPALQSPVFWTTAENDTIPLVFPTLGRATIAGVDTGTYVAFGVNATGAMLHAQQVFCIYNSWTAASCAQSFTTSDLAALSNATNARIGIAEQATQAANLQRNRATAEEAWVPFMAGFISPIDGSTWWLSPLAIIIVLAWLVLAFAAMTGRLRRGGD